eukprot:5981367-Pyramimonas_sp.AAC.1
MRHSGVDHPLGRPTNINSHLGLQQESYRTGAVRRNRKKKEEEAVRRQYLQSAEGKGGVLAAEEGGNHAYFPVAAWC